MALFSKLVDAKTEAIDNSNNKSYVLTDSQLNWSGLSFLYNEVTLSFNPIKISEYTYVIEDIVNCAYKIGRTTNNPEMRLTNLRTANPNINMVIVFPSSQYTEKELHDKFDKYKKDREWFFKVKELTDFVNQHIEKNNKLILIYKNLKNLIVI